MEPDASEPLEPDAIFDPGQQQELRPVHDDEANPQLTAVSRRWLGRLYPRAGRGGGSSPETGKLREERQRKR